VKPLPPNSTESVASVRGRVKWRVPAVEVQVRDDDGDDDDEVVRNRRLGCK
jgi:hypothetical protein